MLDLLDALQGLLVVELFVLMGELVLTGEQIFFLALEKLVRLLGSTSTCAAFTLDVTEQMDTVASELPVLKDILSSLVADLVEVIHVELTDKG